MQGSQPSLFSVLPVTPMVLQVIEVPIIAGLFGAKIPPVTWYSAAAAVVGVGLLESAGGNSNLVCHLFMNVTGCCVQSLHLQHYEC